MKTIGSLALAAARLVAVTGSLREAKEMSEAVAPHSRIPGSPAPMAGVETQDCRLASRGTGEKQEEVKGVVLILGAPQAKGGGGVALAAHRHRAKGIP